MAIGLILLLRDYGTADVIVATAWSIGTFIFGCLAPDLDHHLVQKKSKIFVWLKRITHHRGHWHSIIAATIYGSIIFVVLFTSVVYWMFPVGAGIFGYLSHLIEDDVKRIKLEKKPRRAFKIW